MSRKLMRGGNRGRSDQRRPTPSGRLPDFPPILDDSRELEGDRMVRRAIQAAEEASRRRREVAEVAALGNPSPNPAPRVEESPLQLASSPENQESPIVSQASASPVSEALGSSFQSSSREEQESREAVNELEDWIREEAHTSRMVSTRGNLRSHKRKRGRDLTIDDLVSPNDPSPPPSPKRSITPPGPPNREEQPAPKSKGRKPKKTSKPLPIKKAGVMFGGLKEIKTDKSIDPPPGACLNCWRRDHTRKQCPLPSRGDFCINCGRRGVLLNSCPRCSEIHQRDMALEFGPLALDIHRKKRAESQARRTTEKSPEFVQTSKGRLYKIPQLVGSQDVRDKLPKRVQDEEKKSSFGTKPKDEHASRNTAQPSEQTTGPGLLEELREFSLLLEGLSPEAIAQAKAEFLDERRRRRSEGPSSSKE